MEAFWAALVRGPKVTAASTQLRLWAVLAGAWAEDLGQPASKQNHLLEFKQNKAILRNPERPVEDYFNSDIDMPKKISLLSVLSLHIINVTQISKDREVRKWSKTSRRNLWTLIDIYQ